MAKTGFQYYSVETDRYQDKKIRRLKKEFGCSGIAVYDFLLCEIYRVKGCFLEWDDSTAFDVADYFGLKETLVKEIVNYCCAVGLFSRELLTSERVLTSLSIQTRFTDWSKKAKRADIKIPEEYVILPEENKKLPEESHKNMEENTQSKVKKSKEEKRKAKPPAQVTLDLPTEISNPPPCSAAPPSTGPPFEDVDRWFRGAGGTTEMAQKFYNKWDAVGWVQNGSRIVRWTGLAGNFIVNYRDNDKKNERSGKQSTAGSINAIDAATAELIRDLNSGGG